MSVLMDGTAVARRIVEQVAAEAAGFKAETGGILRLLDEYEVELAGKHAVVVGRSPILGKPVGMLLLARDATVTYCHSKTVDLASYTREADILIAAVGKPRFLTGDAVKPGA